MSNSCSGTQKLCNNPPVPKPRSSQRISKPTRAIALFTLLASPPSFASSVLETIGAPGTGNGFTARVLSRGTEVTYFNPSLLPDVPPSLSFGVLVLGTRSRIRLSVRPSGVDVPESVYDADLVRSPSGGMEFWPQPTSQLLHRRGDTQVNDVTPYVALGLVRPLVNDRRLVFGFFALVPATGFLQQESFFADEREQFFSNRLHFELLGDRLRVPTLAAAMGGRIAPQVSWGAGIDMGMATRTRMQVYIPNAADQRTLLMVPEIDTVIAASPFVGLALRPWRRALVTATLHTPKSWDTNGSNRLRFWDYAYPSGETAVVQSYELTQGSEPLRVGVGVGSGGEFGSTTWELGVQGVWTQWSKYRDRHAERPVDPWNDTVNLGLGWTLQQSGRRLTAELGVAPSPVPAQRGRTNYVDNTRWGTSLGFELPFSYLTTDYVLGLYLQGQFMFSRSVEKHTDADSPVRDELPDGAVDRVANRPLPGSSGLQTNNPGYPGYTSSGMMAGVSLVLKVLR